MSDSWNFTKIFTKLRNLIGNLIGIKASILKIFSGTTIAKIAGTAMPAKRP
jgi:hypothetical protein